MSVSNQKLIRKQYTAEFKDQAVARAEKDGVRRAAKDLGLREAQIYSWRAKKRQGGSPLENQKLQEAEYLSLKRENARLAEENAFLKKAAAYFAKEPK